MKGDAVIIIITNFEVVICFLRLNFSLDC